jgi:hypothetical protein
MSTETSKNSKILGQAIRAALAGGLLLASVPAVSLADVGDLVLTSTFYAGTATPIFPGTTTLPGATAGATVLATNDGTYPGVFQNNAIDANFGVTTPIFITTVNSRTGATVDNYNLTNIAAQHGVNLVSSFSSKSELAIHQSTDGKALTLNGYNATPGLLDISNSNTPGLIDTTNPTYGFATPTYRAVAQINADGSLMVTNTNAYSGNNGRSSILNSATNQYFMVGNAGNSGKPAPNGTFLSQLSNNTGVQTITAGSTNPSTTVIGLAQGTLNSSTGYERGFAVALTNPLTGLPYGPADKTGKDDNFRGQTVFNNTLYVTKGSGGNGINTVYQVGNGGDFNTLNGNSPISVLPGLPADLASGTPTHYPFGIWFANATTLYVADEGNGSLTDVTNPAKTINVGLQKWVLESDGLWHNIYTLQNGLNLGVNYTVSGSVGGVSGSYTAATAGLRNLTGRVNGDGSVTLFAVTATVSTSADVGADPNKLVSITDMISATTPGREHFSTLQTAAYGQVFRGVSLYNGTCLGHEIAENAAKPALCQHGTATFAAYK